MFVGCCPGKKGGELFTENASFMLCLHVTHNMDVGRAHRWLILPKSRRRGPAPTMKTHPIRTGPSLLFLGPLCKQKGKGPSNIFLYVKYIKYIVQLKRICTIYFSL